MNDLKKYASELGKKGGQTTYKRHGSDYFRELQRLSTESKKRKKSVDNFIPSA